MRLGSSMPRFCVVAGVKIDSLGDRLHCQWPIVDILARKEYPDRVSGKRKQTSGAWSLSTHPPSDPVDTPDQVCDVTKVVRNHVYETPRNVLLPDTKPLPRVNMSLVCPHTCKCTRTLVITSGFLAAQLPIHRCSGRIFCQSCWQGYRQEALDSHLEKGSGTTYNALRNDSHQLQR